MKFILLDKTHFSKESNRTNPLAKSLWIEIHQLKAVLPFAHRNGNGLKIDFERLWLDEITRSEPSKIGIFDKWKRAFNKSRVRPSLVGGY